MVVLKPFSYQDQFQKLYFPLCHVHPGFRCRVPIYIFRMNQEIGAYIGTSAYPFHLVHYAFTL